MHLIFPSSPTLLIKLICVGTASENAHLKRNVWTFCRLATLDAKFVRKRCFFDQIRVPFLWIMNSGPPPTLTPPLAHTYPPSIPPYPPALGQKWFPTPLSPPPTQTLTPRREGPRHEGPRRDASIGIMNSYSSPFEVTINEDMNCHFFICWDEFIENV